MADLYDFPFGYRGLTLNAHRTAAGLLDATKLQDTIRVDRFDFSRLQQRDQREPLHLLTGGDVGDATLAFRYLSLAGSVLGSSGAKLSDLVESLQQAFNVEEAQRQFVSTEGLSAFTFTDVTEVVTGRGTAHTDPVTALAAGQYVVEKFLARPAAYPIITERRSGGDSCNFAVELLCADPRRYIATAESVVLNAGNGFTAACPNWDANQGVATSPVLTILMSGAGNVAFSFGFDNDGVAVVVLNLTGRINGDVITYDCATGIIKVNGVRADDLRTSAVTTIAPFVVRGGSVALATNTGGVTSVTIAYNQARA